MPSCQKLNKTPALLPAFLCIAAKQILFFLFYGFAFGTPYDTKNVGCKRGMQENAHSANLDMEYFKAMDKYVFFFRPEILHFPNNTGLGELYNLSFVGI